MVWVWSAGALLILLVSYLTPVFRGFGAMLAIGCACCSPLQWISSACSCANLSSVNKPSDRGVGKIIVERQSDIST